jgi:ectoine hydroxylase-related dioxygenase (phytanoyl-CoA dioxygenase family)
MIAITGADRSNGCLCVLQASHLCGRIDHGRVGAQRGADIERVEALIARLPVVYCELKSGSVLYFHCNLLHSSEPNLSDRPRISYICCYNALSNPPLTRPGHGPCEPIILVEDNLDAWKTE